MPALPGRADRHGDHFIVCGDGPLAVVWQDDVGNFHAGLRAAGMDWSPRRGYLLASGDRLIVLATRAALGPFLAAR